MEYIEKPKKVKATQWQFGQQNPNVISRTESELAGHNSSDIVEFERYYCIVKEFKYDILMIGESEIKSSDWIVEHPNGEIELLTNAKFNEKYIKI